MGVGIASVGAGIGAALADATKAAVEYERQAAKTLTQTDGLKASLEDIKEQAKRVALEIPAPFEQMQGALYDIYSSMDVNLKDGEKLLREFSKAAVAGQVDLQDAARGTIGILNAYGLGAESVNRINDVMFQLVRKGVGTYDEFAKTIGRAVPSAVRAGQSIEDLAGMLAFLTRNGLSTAMAATSAARALDAISHPATVGKFHKLGVEVVKANGQFRPMAQIIEDLGKKLKALPPAKRVQVLQELFKGSGGTIQARRFFDTAIKGYGELIQRTDEMKNSTGVLEEAYAIMADTAAVKMQDVRNAFEVAKVELGDVLIPILLDVVKVVKDVLAWWNKLSPSMKRFITIGALVAAGLTILAGIVLIVVGAITMLAGVVSALGIGLGPLIAIIVGVVAAITAVVAAVKKFIAAGGPVVDFVKTLFKWMGETLKDALVDLREAWDDIVVAIKPLMPVFKILGAIIGSVVIAAILALVAAIKALAWLIKWAVKIIIWLIESIVGGAKTAWNVLWDLGEGIVKIFKWLWDSIVGGWNTFVDTIWKIIKPWVDLIVGAFKWLYDVLVGHSIVPDMINAIVKWFKNLFKWVSDIWTKLRNATIAVWTAIKNWFINFNRDLVLRIIRFISEVKQRWDNFWMVVRSLWDKGINWLKNLWNNFLLGLRMLWDRLTKPIRDKIDSFVEGIKRAFTNAKDNIKRIWESIQTPLKVPVNFMIGLYNNGIAGMANKLAEFVGIKARLPILQKFAKGGIAGVLPGYTPGRDVMTMPLAAFSGGESIFRPEFTRAVGRGWVDRANAIAARSGVNGVRNWLTGPDAMGGEGLFYSKGGVIPGVVQNFATGGILEKIGNFVKGIKDFTITNVKKAGKALLDKVFGGTVPGAGMIKELMTAFPDWLKKTFLGWLGDKVGFEGAGISGKGAGAAMRFARQQAGKPYIWGGVGPAGYDCSGFMSAIWNVLHGKNPYSRVFTTHGFGATGGPGGFVRNLRSGFMVGVTHAGVGHMAGTLNGVNVESRGSAGVVVGAGARGVSDGLFPYKYGLKFDQGGYLSPGLTLAHNATGRRERVLDPEETRRYERGGTVQNFYIYTQEINPRKHAADLGWEIEQRAV